MNVRISLKSLALVVFAFGLSGISSSAAEAQARRCCQLGDVNFSNTVTTFDNVVINRHIQNVQSLSSDAACRGDVNGDRALTAADTTLISNFILGIISTFPRCGDLDGNNQLQWGSNQGDLNCFTAIALGGNTNGCAVGSADANNDGILDLADITLFSAFAAGSINSFPGCACGPGACA